MVHVSQPSSVRTKSKNIIRFLAGVNPTRWNASNMIQCWKLFVTDDMLQDVVKYKNDVI